MRIVLASPLSPPDIGGPSYYMLGLKRALEEEGHTVEVVAYGHTERNLLPFVRHCWYFGRVFWAMRKTQLVIGLDTWSVGIPAVLASRLWCTPIFLRVGGDVLWEKYVERTQESVLLSQFYDFDPIFTRGERFIFWLTKKVLRYADKVVFTTKWQKEIWSEPYDVRSQKVAVIGNVFTRPNTVRDIPKHIRFIWAGRRIFLKNVDIAKSAFRDAELVLPDQIMSFELLPKMPQEELLEYIRGATAVVLPSLSEVSPNFILESLGEGVPFICTADLGIAEDVLGCGYLVDTRARNALRDAFVGIAQSAINLQFREKIAQFPQERTYRQVAQDFLALYADHNHL